MTWMNTAWMGFLFKETDDPAVAELQICDGQGLGSGRKGDSGHEIAREFGRQLAGLPRTVREIDARINSFGGKCDVALCLHDALKRCSLRLVTTIEGMALSSPAIIVQTGSPRRMAANGVIWAHRAVQMLDYSDDPNGCCVVTAEMLRQFADKLDEMNEYSIRIFAERSGRSKSDVQTMFDADDCMNAEEAKAWGLVDEIVDARPLPATCDFNWRNCPWAAPKIEAAHKRRESQSVLAAAG
jgi:ATP-dependent protease ClpP protease subunit